MFGKQMFAMLSHIETMEHCIFLQHWLQNQIGFARFLPVYQTSSYYIIFIYGDSCLPGAGRLSQFFKDNRGKVKHSSWVLFLKSNQHKIILTQNKQILGWQTLIPYKEMKTPSSPTKIRKQATLVTL